MPRDICPRGERAEDLAGKRSSSLNARARAVFTDWRTETGLTGVCRSLSVPALARSKTPSSREDDRLNRVPAARWAVPRQYFTGLPPVRHRHDENSPSCSAVI